jgi:hypothetical protein
MASFANALFVAARDENKLTKAAPARKIAGVLEWKHGLDDREFIRAEMSDIFPKWTNRLPRNIIIGALLAGTAVTAGVTYYFTPKYTRVGYQPIQPVAFPHSVHVTNWGWIAAIAITGSKNRGIPTSRPLRSA